MKLLKLRPMALSIVALVVLAPAALAQDATDFANKIKAVYHSAGVDITFGPATANGGDITYDGATITATAQPAGTNSIKVPTKFEFTGVTAQPDGSYRADALKLPDYDFTVDGSETSIKGIMLKHIYVPATTTPSMVDVSRIFGEASIGPIMVTGKDGSTFSLDSISVSNSFKPAQGDASLAEIDSNLTTNGLKFVMGPNADPTARQQAEAWGLTTITGKALETMTWSLKDGHLNASELSLALDKIGKLKFSFDLTGYTPALLETLSKMGDAMAKSGATDQGKATAMLLASLQTLFINSVSLRYDDDSIAQKIINLMVAQAGTDKASYIDQVVASLPSTVDSGSSSPTPPEVMKTMQAATRAFLTDPHSIELKMAPPSPLGVLGIMAAAMAPVDLATQIGLKVLVNDKEITAADAARETGAAPADSGSSGDSSN